MDSKTVDFGIEQEEVGLISRLLKKKNIKISSQDINKKLSKLINSQQIFPAILQKTFIIQLLQVYEKTKKKEVTLLEELDGVGLPVTFVLGTLAKDWPGMSNSILGFLHHKELNVLFLKAITLDYKDYNIGVVLLYFKINTQSEYDRFKKDEKEFLLRIKEASRGGIDRVCLLEDEAIKFEIYSEIIKKIKKMYEEKDIEKLIGQNGEAFMFLSSRSREYLEERKVSDLAKLIVDNHRFQKMIRDGARNEIIKIKNFETKYEKLTGITFVCKEFIFSVEDFLQTLKYLVPEHIIMHHKSFVTPDGILVYRIEIVDRNGLPLSADVIKSIEKSLNKLMITSADKKFSQIKAIGGFEHYARAIIPFLMEELKRIQVTQVFINADKKTDYALNIKLIIVSFASRRKRLHDIVSRFGKQKGIETCSIIPSKVYSKNIEINILKLNINLADFVSIKDVFAAIKDILKKVFGEIRDFDQGFREADIAILTELMKKLDAINSSLIKEIFFNFDELFRIETPTDILAEVISVCSETVEKAENESAKKLIIHYKNLKEYNRTVLVISFSQQKKLLSRIIKELNEIEIVFTKIEWYQRTYLILVLSYRKQALTNEQMRQIKAKIKSCYPKI